MIHALDISKNFILNKAVREATDILLQSRTADKSDLNLRKKKEESANHVIEQLNISNLQDFLVKMANIAWDFLNVLSICQGSRRRAPHDNQ